MIFYLCSSASIGGLFFIIHRSSIIIPVMRICVPVCAKTAAELSTTYQKAAQVADIIEVRLDYLAENELAPALEVLQQVCLRRTKPVVLTRRIREQGGNSDFSAADAPEFWHALATEVSADYWDWETEVCYDGAKLRRVPSQAPPLIASHHDFTGTPADVTEIYQRLAATGAHIVKIAVQATDITDCLPIFHLLQRAKADNQRVIALAMGDSGLLTRVLGPAYGSWLTFGVLNASQSYALGQPRVEHLRGLYRAEQITPTTALYGVMGWPVHHSLSPPIHNRFFAQSEADAVYLPLAVRDAEAFLRRMVRPKTREFPFNWRGLSVTAPHKQTVIPLLDELTPTAQAIGAVNTITVQEDGTLHGHNTDAEGFRRPLRERHIALRDARCVVLGAGGAARSAVWALREAGADVTLWARRPDVARAWAESWGAKVVAWPASQSLSGCAVVVNTTPLGTQGTPSADATPVTAEQLRGVGLAYDLVYNPPRTPFLRAAESVGCDVLGGQKMLHAQACAQSVLWLGDED